MTLEIPQRSGPSRGERRNTMAVSGEVVQGHLHASRERPPPTQHDFVANQSFRLQLCLEARAHGHRAMRAMGMTPAPK
jgi:hypothetical protein